MATEFEKIAKVESSISDDITRVEDIKGSLEKIQSDMMESQDELKEQLREEKLRAIRKVFQPYLDQFIMIFINDILVYSKSEVDHDKHLWVVWKILHEKELYAKLSKCDFRLKEVMLLGHVVSNESIRVDQKKIDTILEWKQPKNVSEIKSFLSLMRYYEILVERFSFIVALLTKLLRNNATFKWIDKQQTSFKKLKSVLTQASVLIQPKSEKKYVMYNDTSHTGLGYVLMQEEYYPGKANVVADALIWRSMTELRTMFACLSLFENGGLLAELQVKPTWFNKINDKQLLDESLVLLVQQFEEGKTLNFGFYSDGILCFQGRVCMPNGRELRLSILREAHSCPYAMHLRGNKMYRDLRELYWQPRLN
nr:unnamed protein product [Gossypium raimondii]